MICSWEAWKDAFGIPCIQLLAHGIPLPQSLCAAGVKSPQSLTETSPTSQGGKQKVTPNHQDTWQSGIWECWGHPSCSMPPPSPPPCIEEQEKPGWRSSRLGCSETNPEWHHSTVSQRPTPVPKRHQRGSAALRTLCPYQGGSAPSRWLSPGTGVGQAVLGGAAPPPAPSGFTDPGEKEPGLGRPSNLGTARAGEARAPKALAAAAGGHSAVPWGHPSIPRDPSPRSPRPRAVPARPAPAGPGMLALPEPFWRRVPQPCAR